ncbi:MAG: MFS transporter [Planctomycetes bacterium]|nr:MFS transporter [Planctomycetota bacterium]
MSLPSSAVLLADSDRPTGRHYAILLLSWSVWFFGFFSLLQLTFMTGPVETALRPNESQLAWLLGIGIGMTGVGGFLFGWLSDRVGRRWSMALSLLTYVAGNAACAAAPTLGLFAAARALAGLGIGGSWGAGQALVGETFPPAMRGRFGAIAQTGAPVGLGLAAVMGSFVAPEIGWRATFALSTVPILVLALVPFVPESDLWMARRRNPALPRELVGPFVKCFLLTALNMSNYWLAVVWLPGYLQKERGLTESRSGWATLTFVAGSLAGYLGFGFLSDRIGRRPAFTLCSALMATGLAMFTLYWHHIEGMPKLILAFLFLAGLGTGTWSGYGPMYSELFPTAVRGTVMAIIMNVTRGTQFLAPLLIAAVAPRYGMGGGIALAAGFAVLMGAWVWTLPETRGKRIE